MQQKKGERDSEKQEPPRPLELPTPVPAAARGALLSAPATPRGGRSGGSGPGPGAGARRESPVLCPKCSGSVSGDAVEAPRMLLGRTLGELEVPEPSKKGTHAGDGTPALRLREHAFLMQ